MPDAPEPTPEMREAVQAWLVSRLCITGERPPAISCPTTEKCSCLATLAKFLASREAAARADERKRAAKIAENAYCADGYDIARAIREGRE